MSAPELPRTRARTGVVVFFVVLTGLVGIGRLAMEAWLNRPAPAKPPKIVPDVVPARTQAPGYVPQLLLVIIDGLRESSAWAEDDPPMPWLQSLRDRAAWGVGIAGEPTLTAPCVRALLTGRRPDLLTGFRNFNAREVEGSLVQYGAEGGARTVHAGDAAAFQFCKRHYDGEDVLQFPDQGPTDQGESDLASIAFLHERIAAVRPDVITLHLTFPDHAGHKHGAVGREYWHACNTVDTQIQGIVTDYLAAHPEGVVLIAADHGVSPMGTHGGGESSAKRAPFALLGPGVAPGGPFEVDQCALAPTVATLLGVAQPPLADAPPAREMLALSDDVEIAAIDAYVRARLAVARGIGREVDFIERRRAELSVERSGNAESQRLLDVARAVNAEINPSAAGHATLALLLAALWLMALVHIVSVARTTDVHGPVAFFVGLAGLLLTFDPIPGLIPIGPATAGLLALVVAAVGVAATATGRLRGVAITLGCLAAVPVLTGAGLTLQYAFELADNMEAATLRMGVFLLALAGLMFLFLKPRQAGQRLLAEARAAPGLVAAAGGAVLGFSLTLRPFIDPFLHLMVVYASIAVLVVGGMLLSRGAREQPSWLRASILVVALVLFLSTRIAEGLIGQVWVNATPKISPSWLLAGATISVIALALIRWKDVVSADRPAILVATTSLALAFILRLTPEAELVARFGHQTYLVLTIGTTVVAFAALILSLFRGSPEGRLLVRVVAALALARRLSVMDAEFAVFAVVAVGAVLMARMPLPRTRLRIACMAVGILAIRTAIFHAMGFEESFSTLDVGQAFTGLGTGKAQSLDAAGGIVISWQIIVATIQLAIRMALPWVLILASVVRSYEATEDAGPEVLHVLLMDLALTFAARGAAILTALWAWWRSSWWMTHAYTVYAFGAADVLLLLVCAVVAGGWRRGPASGVPHRSAVSRAF